MIILGIETTCDEMGVGIVKDGSNVLANVVASSAAIHKKYGGVMPEIAAREQVRSIIPVTQEGLHRARLTFDDVDQLAVAFGPGLLGSLLVGVETAKTMAIVFAKPLVAVNHLIGHVYANWLTPMDNREWFMVNGKSAKALNNNPYTINFPLVALIVSGGHTDLLLMKGHGQYRWLGGTRDDAAGEAFDKVARILGLGYPGGPEVEKLATSYRKGPVFFRKAEASIKLPRPMIKSPDFDFSFSGIKTAVANLVHSDEFAVHSEEEIAYEFQNAITDILVIKTLKAARQFSAKSIVVGGGVAANEFIQSRFTEDCSQLGIPVFFPTKNLAIDNGAMIAAAAFRQKNFVDPLILQADPALHFELSTRLRF